MNCNLERMTPKEYKKWMNDPRKKDASLKTFFGAGETRTLNVIEGKATQESVNKWNSFKARHEASYCENPTYKQGIALRNWGIKAPIKGLKK